MITLIKNLANHFNYHEEIAEALGNKGQETRVIEINVGKTEGVNIYTKELLLIERKHITQRSVEIDPLRETTEDAFIEHFSQECNFASDPKGNNPFHWAAKRGFKDAWICLSRIYHNGQKDSPIFHKNQKSKTAWDLALALKDYAFLDPILLDEAERNPEGFIMKEIKEGSYLALRLEALQDNQRLLKKLNIKA